MSTIVRRWGGEEIAVDGSLGMATAAALTGAPAVQGDAASFPFRVARFHVVIAAFLLNHLADPVAALREARRVLVPGGALLSS